MNSNYIIPVSVAAAVHAAVLFGFSKSPKAYFPTDVPEGTRFEIPLAPIEVCEPSEPSGESSQEKSVVEPPPFRQPEPLALVTETGFKIALPPIDPSVARGDSDIIPRTFNLGVGPGDGAGPGFGPILAIMLDNSPRTRFQASPQYPFAAKSAGITGEVLVEFTVDESGRVVDPQVMRSTDRVFDEPTLRAVAKWQFEPGRRAGRIVRFRMAVPVRFNLNE